MAKLPKSIDRYSIDKILGTGAMGSVYNAWDPKLQREVAIKIVGERIAQEDKGRARFAREARAIASLRHPNIVEIYDYSGPESSQLYLVMEKLLGSDLFVVMHQHGAMPESVVAAIGYELCSALSAAHQIGIVHRDLKPENVFVTPAGRVVLMDFGIVKAVHRQSSIDGFYEPTDVIGTPGFMAPELMTNKQLTPAIDLFALGAVLYNLLTLRLPFENTTPLAMLEAAKHATYARARLYAPLVSDGMERFLDMCLSANPKKRPESAESARLLLQDILAEQGVRDVRDEVKAFLTASDSFRTWSRQRSVAVIWEQLQLARISHDRQAEQRHKQRLAILDPNKEMGDPDTGIIQQDGHLRIFAGRFLPTPPSWRWFGSTGQAEGLTQIARAAALSPALWLMLFGVISGVGGVALGWSLHLYQHGSKTLSPFAAIKASPQPIASAAGPNPTPSPRSSHPSPPTHSHQSSSGEGKVGTAVAPTSPPPPKRLRIGRGVEILVNGQSRGSMGGTDRTLLLDPGKSLVVLRKEGKVLQKLRYEVSGGHQQVLLMVPHGESNR